ncbi:MAG: signal peptidase II [bacterium]
MKNTISFYGTLFSLFFILDRVSKFLVLTSVHEDTAIIHNFFTLSVTWNKGVSWSLLSFKSTLGTSLLTGFILCVIVSFGIYTYINYKKGLNIILEIMVLAGALSNIADRFLYGAVLDFLEFNFETWYWPTFNIADILIVVGILGIILKNSVDAYVTKNKKSLP